MRTCPRFIAASIVLAVTLAWSSLAGALSLTFVLPGPSGGEDARAAAIEAEVRAIANGGYPVTAETVAMGSTRLSGDLVIALGPAASAWLRGQSITGIKILAGTLVADQPPGVDSGLSVAVGWSVADGIQLLTGLSLPTVVAVGQGKAPVGLRIPWLSPETARTRHWDGGAAGVVLAPDGFDGRTALVAKLRSSGVAVYDLRGGDRIDPNAVGGPAAAISTDRLARWIALIARDVAAGQKRKGSVEDVRSTTAGDAVRPDVLQSLELDLPWQVASRSRWLPPAPMPGGLSLDGATRKALETNYGLRSARASIEAAEADITAARANLMPSVDLGMSGAWIDQDRAASGGGANPELTLTGDASLTQLIYSHDVYTQLRSTKAAAEATRQSVASVRLDTVRGAALAWLRAQRAHANLDVRARLLDSTRTNQGLANARKRAGQSGDADIVRWESQVATDTAGLMSALLELTRARLALNAALGQGGAAGAPVSTVDFEQVLDTVGARGIMAASSGGRKRRAVESLLIRTAQRLDPDLAQLDAQIRAQHLVATGTRVGLWVPTVSVSAQLSQQLANGGTGSRPDPAPAGFPDQTSGSVLLGLQWPLFDGGARYARIRRADADKRGLVLRREGRLVTIEQDVRTTFRTFSVTLAQADLQGRAAEAAARNAGLVTESYRRGNTGISALLDARDQEQSARLAAVDARFTVVESLIELYRAVGAFYFLLEDEERKAWDQALSTAK